MELEYIMSEFHNPHYFYVVNRESRIDKSKINTLQKKLNNYADNFIRNVENDKVATTLEENQMVLYKYNHLWMRAIIISKIKEKRMNEDNLLLFLKDYGVHIECAGAILVPLLDEKLCNLPAVGVFHGSLRRLSELKMDKNSSNVWDGATIRYCNNLFNDCESYVEFVKDCEDEENQEMLYGDLKITNCKNNTTFMLSEALVNKRMSTHHKKSNRTKPREKKKKKHEQNEICYTKKNIICEPLHQGNGNNISSNSAIILPNCSLPLLTEEQPKDYSNVIESSQSEPKHHRLARLDNPRLYVQNRLPVRPVTCIASVNFSSYIHDNLAKMGITEVFRLQAYSWPLLLTREPLLMINPPKSGKTIAYLPAVCCHVSYEEIKDAPHGLSPIALILAPSVTAVENIYRYIRKMDREKTLKVIRIHHWNSKRLLVELPNGWDIVVATPDTLMKLLLVETVISLKKIDILVLDDVNDNCKDTLAILSYCQRRIESGDVQLIVTSENYTKFNSNLLKRYDLSFMVGAHLESAIYAGVRFNFQILEKNKKLLELNNILQKEIHEKVLVICENQIEVITVSKQLKLLSFAHSYAHENTPGKYIEDIYSEWKNCGKYNTIIVCSDPLLNDFDITDATAIIHYSLPSTWTGFTYRFSCMISNFKSPHDEEDRITCYSYSLIAEDNVKHLPRIVSFMERMGQNIGESLKAVVKKEKLRRENERAAKGALLCESLLVTGMCNLENTCTQRHYIIKSDTPAKHLPTSGDIKLMILRVISVNHYIARIVSHRLNRNEEWTHFKFKCMSPKCTLYYNNLETPACAVQPKVGYLCAIDNGIDGYERCKILKIKDVQNKFTPVYVDIELIDIGITKRDVSSTLLLELPEHLKNEPPSVISVRICGIKPHDDIYWSYEAVHMMKNIIKLPIPEGEYFTSKVGIVFENTIWVNDIRKTRMCKNKEIHIESLRMQILDQEIGVPYENHLTLLKKMWEESEFFEVVQSKTEDDAEKLIIETNDCSESTVRDSASNENENQESTFETINLPAPPYKISDTGDRSKDAAMEYVLLNRRNFKELIPDTIKLAKNCSYDIYLICAETPLSFYTTLMSSKKSVENQTKEIQEYMLKSENKIPILASVGQYCLAQSSDGTYNRARVVNVDKNRECCYLVFFIDFGDTAEVSTVYSTTKEFQSLPEQAIKCSLHEVNIPQEKYDDAVDFLYDNCGITWSAEVIDICEESNGGQVCNVVKITITSDEGDAILLNEELVMQCQLNKKLCAIMSKTPPKDIGSLLNLIASFELDDELIDDGYDVVNLVDILKHRLENEEESTKMKITEITEEPTNTVTSSKDSASKDQLVENNINNNAEKTNMKQDSSVNLLPPLVPIAYIPNVVWTQDSTVIKIKVLLPGVNDYTLRITPRHFFFMTIMGNGKQYMCSLKLFGGVIPKLTKHYATGTYVYIACAKIISRPWLSLQYEDKKPVWVLNDLSQEFENSDALIAYKSPSHYTINKWDDLEFEDQLYVDDMHGSDGSEVGENVFDAFA